MKTATLNLKQQTANSALARLSITFAAVSLFMLLLLHFLSPEFDSSWRMVSEYALGRHQWALTLFFVCWGISSWMLAIKLWPVVTTKAAKAGVILLFISGTGEALAALFDVEHSLHGFAGFLGIPMLPVAALLISYHLKRKEEWQGNKKALLFYAHATWLSLVLMVVAMVVMVTGFQEAGIAFEESSTPPGSVPDGVIAIGGYTNRLLILAYVYWLIFVAKKYAVKPGR